MNRNNTEKRAARECREALSIVRKANTPGKGFTLDQAKQWDTARRTLSAWRLCFPNGIPGDGEFSDGIPAK